MRFVPQRILLRLMINGEATTPRMKKHVVQAAVALFSIVVMAEAIYWPIVNKPGTPLGWWQEAHLAEIGRYVGLPRYLLLLYSPFHGTLRHLFAWILVLIWAGLMAWAAGIIVDLIQKRRSQRSPDAAQRNPG